MNNKLISYGILLGILCTINNVYTGQVSLGSIKIQLVNQENPIDTSTQRFDNNNKNTYRTHVWQNPDNLKEYLVAGINNENNATEHLSSMPHNNASLSEIWKIQNWIMLKDHSAYIVREKGSRYKQDLLTKVTKVKQKAPNNNTKSESSQNNNSRFSQPNSLSTKQNKPQNTTTIDPDDTQSFQSIWPILGAGILFIGFCAAIFAFLKK